MLRPTVLLMLQFVVLYGTLVLLGGWLALLLCRMAPDAIRPPAALLGVVLAQVIGWYWSAKVDRGLYDLWPGLLIVCTAGGLAMAWRDRATLRRVVASRSWVPEMGVLVASVGLYIGATTQLLSRGLLSVASPNADVAEYAALGRHLSHAGFSSAGSFVGAHLGHIARDDVYGEFNLFSLSAWTSGRPGFQVAPAVMLLSCVLLAQCVYRLIRRSTVLDPLLAAAIAVVPQSTYLFAYVMMSYFGSQILAMAMAMMLFATLCAFPASANRSTRLAATAVIALLFAGLAMTYPHMLFLFTPIALAIGITAVRERHTAARIIAATGIAFVVTALAIPERSWLAFHRLRYLGSVTQGWPLPGVTPIHLLGFQRSWTGTISVFTLTASVVVVLLSCLAARSVARSSLPQWSLPVATTLLIVLGTYAFFYFGRGGPTYVQWKWISFLQPLVVVALISPVVGFIAVRFRRVGLPITLLCLVLLMASNFNASRLPAAQGLEAHYVSAELGLLGRHPVLANVDELNVDLPPMWDTMWAAVALAPRTVYLRRASYFAISAPHAEWTLVARADLPADSSTLEVRLLGDAYALVRKAP